MAITSQPIQKDPGRFSRRVSTALEAVSRRLNLPRPYHNLMRLENAYNIRPTSLKILYFGDSVLERISRNDQLRHTLGEIVGLMVAQECKTLCVSNSAYNAKVFYHLVCALEVMKYRPEVIILPINLRSFSPQWDLNPLWQFEQEISALKSYVAHTSRRIPYLRAQRHTPASFQAFDQTPIYYALSPFDHIGQFRAVIEDRSDKADQDYRRKQIFIFHYTHRLSRDHHKLNYLEKTIKILERLNISVLAYITPINYEAGQRYAGGEFRTIVESNIETIRRALESFIGCRWFDFQDYSCILSSDYFFHHNEPTEHLDQAGRLALGAMVAKNALKLYYSRTGRSS